MRLGSLCARASVRGSRTDWEPKTKIFLALLHFVRTDIRSPKPKTGNLLSCQVFTRELISITRHNSIEKLIENIRNSKISLKEQRSQLDALNELNQMHLEASGADPALEARIQSFELAFRMQQDAAEAFDVSREPKHALERYGSGVNARQILIARRLVERGVRFVQVWQGQGQPWDHHDDIEDGHRRLGRTGRQGHSSFAYRLKTIWSPR